MMTSSVVPELFPSLQAMRDAHKELLKATSGKPLDDELRRQVLAFLETGTATGVVLQAHAERTAAQALLDYWVGVLFSAPGGSRETPVPDALLMDADPTRAPDLSTQPCPYAGLESFKEEQAARFYGRLDVLRSLMTRLAKQRFLVLTGPSGAGRTSLVNAGLVPRLKAGEVPGLPVCRILRVQPGAEPLRALAAALRPQDADAESWDQEFQDRISRSPEALSEQLNAGPDATPVVLIVERGSELFTQCHNPIARDAFVAALVRLAESGTTVHRVIVHLRDSFYPDFLRLAPVRDLARRPDVAFTLNPPTPMELREMIEHPADVVGLLFAPGLINELVRQVAGEPSALPMLQFALQKLWNAREGNRITWEAYRRVGSPREALQRTAEQVYQALPSHEHQELARKVFTQLIRPSVAQEYTERRLPRAVLLAYGPHDLVDEVLRQFTEAGLLRKRTGEEYEVAHEVLTRCWPRLTHWLTDERQHKEQRLRLEAMREAWETRDRSPDLLLTDDVLLEELQQQYQELEELDRQYLRDSWRNLARVRDAAARRHQRNIQLQWTVIVLLGLCVGLLGAALHFRNKVLQAEQQAHARVKGAQGIKLLEEGDTAGALVWFHESHKAAADERDPVHTDRISLHHRQLPALHLLTPAPPPKRPDARLTDVQHSPASDLLACADQKEVYLLKNQPDSTKQRLAPLQTIPKELVVASLAFSPDGRFLLAVYHNKEDEPVCARLWEITGATAQAVAFPGDECDVYHAAFRPRAEAPFTPAAPPWQLLTVRPGGQNPALRLEVWKDVRPGSPSVRLPRPANGTLRQAVLSPDGSRVLTAIRTRENSAQEVLQMWTWGESEPRTISAGSDVGTALQMLAIAAPVTNRLPLSPWLSPVEAQLFKAEFSADHRLLLTLRVAKEEELGDLLIWDVQEPSTPRLIARRPQVRNAAFSPDGRYMVAAGEASALLYRLELDPRRQLDDRLIYVSQLPHRSSAFMAAFSPDGRRIVTGSRDLSLRVWDALNGKPLFPPMYHDSTVAQVAFSPDGRRVFGRTANALGVWDLANGNPMPEARGVPGSKPLLTTVGTNGTSALVTSDGKVCVWNNKGQEWDPKLSRVTFAALSPGGEWLVTVQATAGGRKKRAGSVVQVWDCAKQEALLKETLRHDGEVTLAAFDPTGTGLFLLERVEAASGGLEPAKAFAHVRSRKDGKRIAGPIQIQVDQPGAVSTFHTEQVTSAALHYDRNHEAWRLVTGSTDDTAKLWDVMTGESRSLRLDATTSSNTHTANVTCVAFNADGSRVLTGSADRSARVWNGHDGRSLGVIQHGSLVTHVAFAHAGPRIVTAGMDGLVRVWHPESSGESFAYELVGLLPHRGRVLSAVFTTHDARLLTLASCEPAPNYAASGPAGNPNQARSYSLLYQWDLRALPAGASTHATSQLFAARKFEKTHGGLMVLDATDLHRHWSGLRIPGSHEQVPLPDIKSWHRSQACEASLAGQWSAVVWHLSRLSPEKQQDGGLLLRRANAYAELKQWPEAARDLELVVDSNENGELLRLLRVRVREALGK